MTSFYGTAWEEVCKLYLSADMHGMPLREIIRRLVEAEKKALGERDDVVKQLEAIRSMCEAKTGETAEASVRRVCCWYLDLVREDRKKLDAMTVSRDAWRSEANQMRFRIVLGPDERAEQLLRWIAAQLDGMSGLNDDEWDRAVHQFADATADRMRELWPHLAELVAAESTPEAGT